MNTEETNLSEVILTHIAKYKVKHGHAPTQSQIGRDLNLSRQCVHYHFNRYTDYLKIYPEYARYTNKKKTPENDRESD